MSKRRRIPEREWVWCGYAGHFIASGSCLLRMNTRVGNYRISTVGDYRPDGPDGRSGEPQNIGAGRKFETFVFRVEGHGEHGEGEVSAWSEIDTEGYNDYASAEAGHMAMCDKYARIAASE